MTIQENISLKELTTLKIGGTARYFCAVSSVEEVKEALAFVEEKQLPFFVLGGGSNILIADGEINAVVVKNEIKGLEWRDEGESVVVTAGAGESWDALAHEAVARCLWGIENLSGIPGTVGAAPVQNIGAYGAELADVLEWVEVNFSPSRFNLAECQFGYRDSIFKRPEGKGFIITRVALRLKKNGTPNISYKDTQNYFVGKPEPTLVEIRKAVLEIRSRKFPDLTTYGTAGSFFKNPIIPTKQFDELKKRFPNLPSFPISERFNLGSEERLNLVKVHLAWILDNLCNLKGLRKGAVGLFPHQPIVLVNFGGASAREVRMFAEDVAVCVKEKTGIATEWEVQHLQ